MNLERSSPLVVNLSFSPILVIGFPIIMGEWDKTTRTITIIIIVVPGSSPPPRLFTQKQAPHPLGGGYPTMCVSPTHMRVP